MELRLQPKPEVEIPPADKGLVSRKDYFVNKVFEQIKQYFFAGHLIRSWRPKAELIYHPVSDESAIQYECDFNRDIQNCFVEDYAEEVFLRTPPPCFVVLGKSGPNVRKLGEDIANEYGSVFIEVDKIVNQVIKTDSETGKFLDRLLRLGVSLTLNFILALLSYVAHSPEARHRGYVLCGLPCLPHLYDLSVEQQLNYLFTWENKPTVFINVLFEDDDLIKDRSNLRYEIEKKEEDTFISLRYQYNENGDNEVEEDEDEAYKDLLFVKEGEEEEDAGYERDVDVSPSQPYVKLPRDGEDQVWSELEMFDTLIKPCVDLTKSRVDPQYFLDVDSRVENPFEMVQARLALLRIWKVPVAVPLVPLKQKQITEENREYEESEPETEDEKDVDDPDILKIIDEPPQTAFLTLFTKKTISPKFRWELSHYNYICPVTLRDGRIIEGKSKFAVGFMKYIYFLRDEDCMTKFIRNPRAYVLPIRPKPPCRFFIIGYPFCGKTQLAESLASEYSITLIDLNVVLREDTARKKNLYKEFCRQKAEAREIIRLTAQSWRDWRMEEEQRINLTEKWIAYIQKLLTQRIEQFYSLAEQENASKQYPSGDNSVLGEYDETFESDDGKEKGVNLKNLKVRGVSIPISDGRSPQREYTTDSLSDKIKRAMKNEDYNFDETGLEVEANLFFSSLWNTFSNYKNKVEGREKGSGDEGESEEKQLLGEDSPESDAAINWASLLPPQSLSSLILQSKPYTTRERRKSFHILLSAASKVCWSQTSLRREFAKWRLPCFMDIPLCEIFLDNPNLLYKYCPEWLKERPMIPDPVDPNHPSVLEAGRKSFNRADYATIKQDKEEVGMLLRDAIEKAEKDGMRITGEVISPGGWVVDNMVLDPEVWSYLVQESIFADHVYILIDTEPGLKRIINMWCEWNCPSSASSSSVALIEDHFDSGSIDFNQSHSEELEPVNKKPITVTSYWKEMLRLINEELDLEKSADEQLDNIFEMVKKLEHGSKDCSLPPWVDLFTQALLQNENENSRVLKDSFSSHEFTLDVHLYSNSSSSFCLGRKPTPSFSQGPLGVRLQILTDNVLNYLNERKDPEKEAKPLTSQRSEDISFFISLLSLPAKLEEIKKYLTLANKSDTIKEIVVTDRTTEDIHTEIVTTLGSHFIKKPRELESFELDEINREFELDMIENEKRFQDKKEEEEEEEEEEDYSEAETHHNEKEERDDIRIYGESGSFCIVNLERNILLNGKPQFVLRYYGKLYFFWNEIAKRKFIEDPEKYAPYYSPIRCLPPVRIFVVGAAGCGKTSIARPISLQCGWPQVEYVKLLGQRLVPHSSKLDRNAILNEKKLLLSDQHNEKAKSALEEFMNAPYEIRKFWLENHVYPIWNLGETFVNQNLTMLKQPSIKTDFPELKYETIEERQTDEKYLEANNESDSSRSPFMSMNQIESNLYDYVQNKSDLDEDCFLKCVKFLWNQEPFIRHGFVLERFPLRSSDLDKITENNFYPDLVLEVSLPERDMIARNIGNSLELWESKLNHEMMEEKLVEDTLKGINEILKSVRRSEMVSENHMPARKPKSEKKSVQSLTSYQEKGSYHQEEQIHNETEKILQKEFPNLVFNAIFESYDSAKERLEEGLTTSYRRDIEEINKIRQIFQNNSVPWLVIDNSGDLNTTLNEIFLKLDPLKRRSNQRGEYAFLVKMEMAEKLLQQGYYFLSKFGRWCPVQVFRMKNSIHMFRPLKAKGKIFPVVYRNYIYFIGGENEKRKFLNDPIKYTFNEPHHPNVPLRVAVIGPPKSGKSTLCQRLGYMFDLKVITMGSALRFVSEKMANTSLNKSIEDYLKRGCFLPLSLKMEALMACLNDPTCVSQGFIFDGIPFDAAMTQSLAENGKLPFVILSLVGDAYLGKVNRENLVLKKFRLPYKQRVHLDTKYKEWNETYKRFSQWNQETYNNLYELKAKLSAADIFYKAYDIIRKSFFGILYYVENCVSDKALPLEYMCVSQNEYELRKSPLHNNCPVCWASSNILSPSTDPPSRSGLVQYQNYFYWVCPKHIENFLKKPKIYLPPNVPEWPKCFPKVLNRTMFEMASSEWEIHGFGRCPVTKVDFPSSLDWEGSWDYAASYGGRVYLCKNKEMLTRFLAAPWRYCGADTAFEINSLEKSSAVEELGPPTVTSLPPIGFLEQTVASLIHKALKVLGGVRPLYPNLTPACTGCTFVGLYLKAYNRKNETSLEMEYLNYMTQECKASRFLVSKVKENEERENAWRYVIEPEPSENDNSDSSHEVVSQSSLPSLDAKLSSVESFRADAKSNPKERMWSAKQFSTKYFEMLLTPEDDLQIPPDLPREDIILRYASLGLRPSPLPPISNCLTYIYTARPNLKLPEKFNYNILRQPTLTPVCKAFIFNPEKPFSFELYHQEKPQHDSASDLIISKRTLSILSMYERQGDSLSKRDINTANIFMPRFFELDTINLSKDLPPPRPTVITNKPIMFNPQRDYTYTLLLSDYFRCSHILRSYTWNESLIHLEYGYLLDKTLGLCPVDSVLLRKPHITVSMTSRRSIDSYMDLLDVTTNFKFRDGYKVEEESVSEKASGSLFNFVETMLMEKLEEAFNHMWERSASYDSYAYDVVMAPANSKADFKPQIIVQETLPNPPLHWNIISSPYHAYQTLSSIFASPSLDNIAHERHYSLLDGVDTSESRLKFIRYSSKSREKTNDEEMVESPTPSPQEAKKQRKPFYFRYDYFHLPWTSFMSFPFSWAYDKEIQENFYGPYESYSSHEHLEGSI